MTLSFCFTLLTRLTNLSVNHKAHLVYAMKQRCERLVAGFIRSVRAEGVAGSIGVDGASRKLGQHAHVDMIKANGQAGHAPPK